MIIWFIVSLFSALAYRLGGQLQTKIRDLGLPAIATVYLLILGLKCSWWAYLLHFGLLFGALTTYWKKKDQDAKWWNWLLTGLGYSLSALPIAIATNHWFGFAIRTITLTAFATFWSEFIGWDILEEGGRGFFITCSLPLLLI